LLAALFKSFFDCNEDKLKKKLQKKSFFVKKWQKNRNAVFQLQD